MMPLSQREFFSWRVLWHPRTHLPLDEANRSQTRVVSVASSKTISQNPNKMHHRPSIILHWELQKQHPTSTWRPLHTKPPIYMKRKPFFTVWEFGPIVPPIWSDQATTGTSREQVLPPPPALAELSSSSPSVSCNGSISTSSGRICAIQAFWDIIHPQLLSLLQLFHSNGLYVWRLTKASITLLPKKKDANTVEDFRPISIISRFMKIVSKKRNKHCL